MLIPPTGRGVSDPTKQTIKKSLKKSGSYILIKYLSIPQKVFDEYRRPVCGGVRLPRSCQPSCHSHT